MLSNLDAVIVSALSITFKRLCQMGEIYENWKRENVMLINKKNENSGTYKMVRLTAVPGEGDEITNS